MVPRKRSKAREGKKSPRLETVERLARRRPDLAIAVVGMLRPSESGGLISADELAAGDWLVLVPPAPQRADAD